MTLNIDLEKGANHLNASVRELGLERAEAMLSEGFCISCRVRSAPGPIFEEEDLGDTPTPSAVVWCAQCSTHWRTGTNPGNGRPWIAHSQARKNMTMTMIINAVREIEEEEDGFE